MAEVLEAGEPGAIERAAETLGRGGVAVLPTDTVYGVGARPDVPGATAVIFEVKHRPRELTLPVLAPDAEVAAEVAVFDGRARALAEAFWPGGLTMVLPRTGRSEGWDLGAETGTVGVRVPRHDVALRLLRRTGPLAVTSANRSGEPPADSCDAARAALGDGVALYLCAGRVAGTASTVVDLGAGPPRVLRSGAVPAEEVLTALGSDPRTL